ncbi:hypothetical protein [Actinoallomurus iriomotensis]|uniref:Uncharacterized protein n=1 Tax=Actinoallomurus iriomotensis TaxID=478107 RepID=A0A9W6SA59_9ACTN|nr:hypothetical protein [Actinoallomurus iriomotensis]GLY72503.1 hypothetical protein Airi01_007700 [Actinoallomurus iriomotensis]GLY90169.1 hypothetical protein Airi02_080980 [Actinoallomurus iriomotensis]
MSDENAALARTRITYLESLGDELRDRGFAVRLTIPQGGPPSLHVVNPRASALAENILAETTAGAWWFWWSWAERIAPANDPAEAADRVTRVLAATGEYSS